MVDQVELLVEALEEAGRALDVADGIIAVHCGTDTPKRWHDAIRKVSALRAKIPHPNNTGEV